MSGNGQDERRPNRGPAIVVAASFVAAFVAGIALLALYVVGGQTQLEGVLLFLCLGGIGFGIVLWSQRLMPDDFAVVARHPPRPTREPAQPRAASEDVSRRRFLRRLLALGLAGLASALAVPVFSLGPAPGRSLVATPWRKGQRLVGLDGVPVRGDGLPIGSIATVFPEDAPGSADGQTLLIHVAQDTLRLPPDRMSWAPDGYVAYSKVCTHAGCPVGLYLTEQHRLLCPCHQSEFDVLVGAQPVSGPAARPLPQLPIQLQPDGTFVALGGFPEPIGPSFWNIHSGG